MSLEDKMQDKKEFSLITNWVWWGAIILGLGIVLYFGFFAELVE